MIRKQNEVIVTDNDDDDVKRKLVGGGFVKEDRVDRFPVSRKDNFPGQKMGNSEKMVNYQTRGRY